MGIMVTPPFARNEYIVSAILVSESALQLRSLAGLFDRIPERHGNLIKKILRET